MSTFLLNSVKFKLQIFKEIDWNLLKVLVENVKIECFRIVFLSKPIVIGHHKILSKTMSFEKSRQYVYNNFVEIT